MMKLCAIAVVLAAIASPAIAQSGSVPVPAEFASAHTLFLSCGGAPLLASREKEGVTMLYTSAYHALSSAGHYRLTSTPADSDITAVISLEDRLSGVSYGSSAEADFIQLAVYDTKTHALLWNIDEPVDGAIRKASFQKNIDASVAKIVADLNSLAAGKLP